MICVICQDELTPNSEALHVIRGYDWRKADYTGFSIHEHCMAKARRDSTVPGELETAAYLFNQLQISTQK